MTVLLLLQRIVMIAIEYVKDIDDVSISSTNESCKLIEINIE